MGYHECEEYVKKAVADALVVHRAKKGQQALTGTLELTDSTTGALLRFVAERYLNVLFGTVMTSLLKFRGKTLTAMELQDRLKTDEDFHRKLIKEYNDSSNTAYGQNAHGQEGCGYTDASNFQPFSEDSWEKSCKFFKELSKNYESSNEPLEAVWQPRFFRGYRTST